MLRLAFLFLSVCFTPRAQICAPIPPNYKNKFWITIVDKLFAEEREKLVFSL